MSLPRAAARLRNRASLVASLSFAVLLVSGRPQAQTALPSGSRHELSPGPVPVVLDARHVPTRETFLAEQGRVLAFEESYERWFAVRLRDPHILRSVTESALLMAIGTAYYWVDPLANSADWDYPTFGQKLSFESVRFDNNLFATNHVLHPLAGAANYGFARVNGFEPAGALASTLLFSVVWEFALEYREQASVNDMLFTPFGGAAIGEFLFQLGEYLNSAPGGGGLPQNLAAATLGLPRRVHNALDRVEAPPDPPRDSLGFSSAYWHRFGAAYEETFVGSAGPLRGNLHGFRADASLAAMPGFLRPGHFDKGFDEGNFVEMRARAGWGRDGLSAVDLWFMSDLAGRYTQDFSIPESGRPAGSAALLTISTAFRFNQREILERHDRFAVAHLMGPRAAYWLGSEGMLGVIDASVHADFAGIHPLALADWQAVASDAGVKSVLAKERYVYTLGFSTRFRARLEFEAAELEAFVRHGQYDSLEGIDRRQEALVRDLHSRDTVFEYGVSLHVIAPGTPLSLRLGAEVLRRTGTLAGVHAEAEERSASVAPGLRF